MDARTAQFLSALFANLIHTPTLRRVHNARQGTFSIARVNAAKNALTVSTLIMLQANASVVQLGLTFQIRNASPALKTAKSATYQEASLTVVNALLGFS